MIFTHLKIPKIMKMDHTPIKTRNPPPLWMFLTPSLSIVFYSWNVHCIMRSFLTQKKFGKWIGYSMKCFIFMFVFIVPIKTNIANTYCHNSHIYENGPKDSMILIMIYLCAVLMESFKKILDVFCLAKLWAYNSYCFHTLHFNDCSIFNIFIKGYHNCCNNFLLTSIKRRRIKIYIWAMSSQTIVTWETK